MCHCMKHTYGQGSSMYSRLLRIRSIDKKEFNRGIATDWLLAGNVARYRRGPLLAHPSLEFFMSLSKHTAEGTIIIPQI